MSAESRSVTLVDCTLRDGSYQVDFGFTAAETSALVDALESAGVLWIEVGHGLGLGAPASGRVKSAESDANYIASAKRSARRAKIGAFAMPAFATTDDLTRARDQGIDFLRFGIDGARFAQAEPFLRHAVGLGVHVTVFLMKSYTLGLDKLPDCASQFRDWGCDAVAIVDSAGGMTPPIVRDYVRITREKSGLPIAFHGHNNLQLAVGNTIAAVEAGATFLDASLHGLGRSAGNAQIEALAIALARCGYSTGCDALALANLADGFIAELPNRHDVAEASAGRRQRQGSGVGVVELLQGHSFVHSGMQPLIDRVAAEVQVDAHRLTVAVGGISDGLDVSEATVCGLAKALRGLP